MSTYAWVDLCSVLVPFLASFHPKLRFHERWWALFPGIAIMMVLFIPWDAAFTRAGVWGFEPEHVWSVRLLHLPMEEWLFFICIPYCCVFSYHCFHVLGVKDHWGRHARTISLVLMVGLLTIALLNWSQAYTFTAWTLCALWMAFTAFIQKAPWLGRFYFAYAALLLPFLVVNGVLTGTGLDRPVVWYDPAENLGLRIGTIPVEDIFYGMLMTGLVVSVYEALLARRGEQAAVREV
ncbi:MAG: lycopene cyclase domain-containing protein [Flavobacteriales bacterium]|nr:lycopene cyclase domain-containing protein [Flavobacteriales bacterium]